MTRNFYRLHLSATRCFRAAGVAKSSRLLLVLALLHSCVAGLRAQATIDFEAFPVPADSFLNGSRGDTAFVAEGLARFPVLYDAGIGFWLGGWALSRVADSSSRDFTNLYAARPGGGYAGSRTYAVGQQGAGIQRDPSRSATLGWSSLYVTNTTYAYYSMRDGDAFAKAFGGASGDDPDYFLLTIQGYREGMPLADSVDFYLADFRFADNRQDYIVDSWTAVDISALAAADSLSFTLRSTDTGEFGINTPLFFAIDQLGFEQLTATTVPDPAAAPGVYPNPFSGDFRIVGSGFNTPLHIRIFDGQGRLLLNSEIEPGESIPTGNWPRGYYWLQWENGRQRGTQTLLKQ